jgi:hypothetical protein
MKYHKDNISDKTRLEGEMLGSRCLDDGGLYPVSPCSVEDAIEMICREERLVESALKTQNFADWRTPG